MDIKVLLAALLVYRSNFHLLHWNAKGKKFDKIHSLSAEYYDKLLDDADIIAEMSARLGHGVVNYVDAFKALKNVEGHNFLIIPSDATIGWKEFFTYTDAMLKEICKLIEEVLDTDEVKAPSNIGIKATLEGLHEYYNLQAYYLNARRSDED